MHDMVPYMKPAQESNLLDPKEWGKKKVDGRTNDPAAKSTQKLNVEQQSTKKKYNFQNHSRYVFKFDFA